MPYSFDMTNKVAKQILIKDKRYIYTTPKSFLELLELFKLMLEKKSKELEDERLMYETGLAKLEETEVKVSEL